MSFFEKSRNTGKINKKIEMKQIRIVHAIAGSLEPSEQKLEKKKRAERLASCYCLINFC